MHLKAEISFPPFVKTVSKSNDIFNSLIQTPLECIVFIYLNIFIFGFGIFNYQTVRLIQYNGSYIRSIEFISWKEFTYITKIMHEHHKETTIRKQAL